MTEATPHTPTSGTEHDSRPLPGAGNRAFWVGLVIVVLSILSGLATFLILTGLTPLAPRNDVVTVVLLINLLLVIAMFVVIGQQAYQLRRAWRGRVPGAQLYTRVVALFSLIAALPALMLTVVATTTFSRAIDGVFSTQTRAIVGNSLDVANAYLEEHGQVIRTDVVNMARDIDDAAGFVDGDDRKFRELVLAQAGLRDLPVAYVIDRKGGVVIAVLENERIPYIRPPARSIDAAELGQVPLLMPNESVRVAAIAKLTKHPDRYLYVARGVNPQVFLHLQRTQAGVAEYEAMRQRQGGWKFIHGLLYFMSSVTAMLAAIWIGLWFAGRLVAPIRRLIDGAQQVAKGDLSVQLPELRGEGDLRRLSVDFNHMTRQLDHQRSELISANSELTERRRFIEAVLSGVSAGVLGVETDGKVTLMNRSAEKLLGREMTSVVGRPIGEAIPEFAALYEAAIAPTVMNRPPNDVTLDVNGVERRFAVRVTREAQGEGEYGAVVTFDDITELVSAQRSSAWADVARRIAHEIKNPLTPIQLSAERLRRKYGAVIKEDREVFDKCTETIIRQVGDVSRMVDEFSSFARMPKPEMTDLELRDAVKDPVVLFQMGSPGGVEIQTRLAQERIYVSADRRLLSQAITNLVKNAAESVASAAEAPDKPADWRGRVEVIVRREGARAIIEVIDNGLGLPKQGRQRLLEPYVTSKGAKGTGLGLAIVQKIVEQHGGTLTLEDAPPAPGRTRGALIRITLLALENSAAETTHQTARTPIFGRA
jgi:two-component system, NtrC family, nitrogen regulation sensor histidine kinase NtrY